MSFQFDCMLCCSSYSFSLAKKSILNKDNTNTNYENNYSAKTFLKN